MSGNIIITDESIVRRNISFVFKEKNINTHYLSGGDKNLYQKLYQQIYRGRSITYDVLAVIINAVPDLSLEWLFRGVGEPFTTVTTSIKTTSAEYRLAQIEKRLAALEDEREKSNAEVIKPTA